MAEEKEIIGVISPRTLGDYTDKILFENGIIYISNEIDDNAAWNYCSQLEAMGKQNRKEIQIIITSPGGEVFAAFAIYDTIRRMKEQGIKIITEARGYAASAAALIMQAGDIRRATENTRLLIHEVRQFDVSEDTPTTSEEKTIELKKVNKMMAKVLATRTGKTLKQIEKIWQKRDVWMSAQEARDFGLIDEVV